VQQIKIQTDSQQMAVEHHSKQYAVGRKTTELKTKKNRVAEISRYRVVGKIIEFF